MRSNTRRSQLDHDRYMANREERLARQREYYRTHKEYYKVRTKQALRDRIEREKKLISV